MTDNSYSRHVEDTFGGLSGVVLQGPPEVAIRSSFFEHWMVRTQDYNYATAFLWMLCQACRQDRTWRAGSSVIKLRRGEFFNTEKGLAEFFGWSRKKVSNFITLLVDDHLVEVERDGKYTRFFVVDFDSYEFSRLSEEHFGNTSGTLREHNNNNNIYNKKISGGVEQKSLELSSSGSAQVLASSTVSGSSSSTTSPQIPRPPPPSEPDIIGTEPEGGDAPLPPALVKLFESQGKSQAEPYNVFLTEAEFCKLSNQFKNVREVDWAMEILHKRSNSLAPNSYYKGEASWFCYRKYERDHYRALITLLKAQRKKGLIWGANGYEREAA